MTSPKLSRNIPPRDRVRNQQDTLSESNSEVQLAEDPMQPTTAPFCVDYETRDGSAKSGKDYHSLKGTVVCDVIIKLG